MTFVYNHNNPPIDPQYSEIFTGHGKNLRIQVLCTNLNSALIELQVITKDIYSLLGTNAFATDSINPFALLNTVREMSAPIDVYFRIKITGTIPSNLIIDVTQATIINL